MDTIKVYWFGYGGNSWMAEKFRNLIECDLEMELITIHEHDDANIKYDLNTVYQELQNADIIILPANYMKQPCKSNNRLTQAWALKKPIICSPLPAYENLVIHGVNGYICESDDDWERCLTLLRDDSHLRKRIGESGYKIAQQYTIEKKSEEWISALKNINVIKVDVIIPTKNNIEILEKCLDSFKNSTLEETAYIVENGEGVEELVKKYNIPYEVKEI